MSTIEDLKAELVRLNDLRGQVVAALNAATIEASPVKVGDVFSQKIRERVYRAKVYAFSNGAFPEPLIVYLKKDGSEGARYSKMYSWDRWVKE